MSPSLLSYSPVSLMGDCYITQNSHYHSASLRLPNDAKSLYVADEKPTLCHSIQSHRLGEKGQLHVNIPCIKMATL